MRVREYQSKYSRLLLLSYLIEEAFFDSGVETVFLSSEQRTNFWQLFVGWNEKLAA
jgi:hypothetical protein